MFIGAGVGIMAVMCVGKGIAAMVIGENITVIAVGISITFEDAIRSMFLSSGYSSR